MLLHYLLQRRLQLMTSSLAAFLMLTPSSDFNASAQPVNLEWRQSSPLQLPYRLTWGKYSVIVEQLVSDEGTEGTQQVRIIDQKGHAVRAVRDHVIRRVAIKDIYGGPEPELIIWTEEGGNGGFCNEYAFTQQNGIKNIFEIADAGEVDLQDLDGDKKQEIVEFLRLTSIDGSGTHHYPRLACVYRSDGSQFCNVTAVCSEPASRLAGQYKDSLAARERSGSSSAYSGSIDDAIGYLTNMSLIGRAPEAVAWLQAHVPSTTMRWLSNPQNAVSLREELRDASKPLPVDQATVLGPSSDDGPLKDDAVIPMKYSATPAFMIIPGKSSGKIQLGMLRSEVQSILGKPVVSIKLRNGVLEDYWADKSEMRADALYQDGRCIQAEVMDPTLRANSGISTGTSIRAFFQDYHDIVLNVYGYDLDTKAMNGEAPGLAYITPGEIDICFYDSIRSGIAVEIGTQDEFTLSDKPEGVIVHRPGHPALVPTYGVFNHTPHPVREEDRELLPTYIYNHLSGK